MVDSLNKVDNLKMEYIASLSENGLELLLDSLTKKYYKAYVDGDADKMQSAMAFIKDIEMIVEDKLYSFDVFVNYCMLCNANIIIKAFCKSDVELLPYGVASINPQNSFDNLISAFNNSKYAYIHGVDRINIRKLYDLCVADETLDGEIMAIVGALHDSFIDKEKYKDEINGGAYE